MAVSFSSLRPPLPHSLPPRSNPPPLLPTRRSLLPVSGSSFLIQIRPRQRHRRDSDHVRAAMGISKVTGVAATALLVTSLALWEAGMRIATAPFLATSFVAYIVTVASHTAVNLPWILGKKPSGRFPLWSAILFGPFLMLARTYAMVKRFIRKKENVFDEIAEGLYLGGWPFMAKHLPPGDPSVVDCTCELPRSEFVKADEYLCVATWDTRAPATYQIESAARWACEKRAEGKPVYVHCAFGHGRSACVMCAILVAMGIAENWKDAENIIRGRRKIKMNALHRKTLEDWSKHRVAQKKEN